MTASSPFLTSITTLTAEAVAWLARPQPAGARMQHHGFPVGCTGVDDDDLQISVCPRGAEGRPVVVAARRRPRHSGGALDNPLTPADVDALRYALRSAGTEVAREWNGPPAETVSLSLTTAAHPELLAAVDRYRSGCINHPDRSVFCRCDAWREGLALAVRPAATAPTRGDSDD